MVELNFDRAPARRRCSNLNEVARAARLVARERHRCGSAPALTYTEAMAAELAELLPALAEASRTVGSPQIRNRGTIGGNLATASPAGDALPPLLVEGAEVELRERARHAARCRSSTSSSAPKRNALAPDELIVAVRVRAVGARRRRS